MNTLQLILVDIASYFSYFDIEMQFGLIFVESNGYLRECEI